MYKAGKRSSPAYIAFLIVILICSNYLTSNIVSVGFNSGEDEILVTVSIEAISFFVEEIGGPYVKVIPLVPEGVEFHHYILTSDVMEQALKSDLLIITGHLAWEKELIEVVSRENSKVVILDILSDLSENLTLLKFPGTNELNLHGYWLYPENAIVIARRITDILSNIDTNHFSYYEDSYKLFRERVEKILEYAREKIIRSGLAGLRVVAVTPPEQYVLVGFGLNVCVVLTLGGLQDIPPSVLENVRKGLISGKYSIIVMSDLARKLHIYEYVVELSQITNKPVIEIRTISLHGIKLYETILTYDLAKIISIKEIGAMNTYEGSNNVSFIVYILVFILGIIALVEGVIIRRSK